MFSHNESLLSRCFLAPLLSSPWTTCSSEQLGGFVGFGAKAVHGTVFADMLTVTKLKKHESPATCLVCGQEGL